MLLLFTDSVIKSKLMRILMTTLNILDLQCSLLFLFSYYVYCDCCTKIPKQINLE